MTDYLDLDNLSKDDIERLVRKSQKRLETIDQRIEEGRLGEEERVLAVTNDILVLARQTGIPKGQIFAAVAGNLRQSLDAVLPASSPDDEAQEEALDDQWGEALDASDRASLEAIARELLFSRPSGDAQQDSASDSEPGSPSPSSPHERGEHRNENGKVVNYRHPADASKTWDGRGEMPKWLCDAISFGRSLEEFRTAYLNGSM